MAATESFAHIFGINHQKLTSKETLILEIELFTRICEELKEFFRSKNKDYFSLLKISVIKENAMLESKFLLFVIQDILRTEEYSLEGIAYHTQIPEDVICDVASGKNKTPSLLLSQKIIDLHRKVRPDLYKEVIKKITNEHLISV